jgi:phosphomevalonate kinase
MIAGEYTVLGGAPAICMAIDRRARATIRARAGERHSISAPGFHADPIAFDSIREIAASIPLLAAAWDALSVKADERLNITIDTGEFMVNGDKLGIGSSAAATVALVAALSAAFETDSDVLQDAHTVHRNLQGGAGSGADIACSFAGGVIEYRRSESQPRSLSWPADLHYALLWSGRPADTRTQLEKFDAVRKAESAAALQQVATQVAAAWHRNVTTDILAGMQDYVAALRSFDEDHDLGIYAAGHLEVARQATAADIIYKPCGAGGGDLGIALAGDTKSLAGFVSMARTTGFKPVQLAIDAAGVVVEEFER